jgi:hypothetical protein
LGAGLLPRAHNKKLHKMRARRGGLNRGTWSVQQGAQKRPRAERESDGADVKQPVPIEIHQEGQTAISLLNMFHVDALSHRECYCPISGVSREYVVMSAKL